MQIAESRGFREEIRRRKGREEERQDWKEMLEDWRRCLKRWLANRLTTEKEDRKEEAEGRKGKDKRLELWAEGVKERNDSEKR